MKILCLHHNDADGRSSGAIIKRALTPDVELYEMNYGDPIPWDKIETAKQVIVVDFSLPIEDMQRLADSKEFVWIDHHKSAMETMADVSGDWAGIRSLDEAACVLTWQYYFPDEAVPKAVVLIGDRDIWRWAEKDTGSFSEGLFYQNTDADNDELWVPLLDDNKEMVDKLIKNGAILRAAQLTTIERKIARFGHEVDFEGHRTLVVNDRGMGEMGQHIGDLGYDIGYCYVDIKQDGKLMTMVTLYSKTVDVSKIAKKYGGGGHAGAAGFSFERGKPPFPSLN